ncbi:hypothetical protein C8F04DRAFT_1181544 [Mycena alexandri]|uniref:Uncharacterized protein n=1 Tax=Mycena alexandri TaxID=1745969 RepID=A0AAD6X294_9AGAR|nr:hypothetical protein C8F04DRAFT_1181544 [Mycena alexandri]
MPLFTSLGPPLTVCFNICVNLTYTSVDSAGLTSSSFDNSTLERLPSHTISTLHPSYGSSTPQTLLNFSPSGGLIFEDSSVEMSSTFVSREVEFKFNDLWTHVCTSDPVPMLRKMQELCSDQARTTETIVNLSRSRFKILDVSKPSATCTTKFSMLNQVHPLGLASPTGYMPSTFSPPKLNQGLKTPRHDESPSPSPTRSSTNPSVIWISVEFSMIPPAKFRSGNLSKSLKQMNQILALKSLGFSTYIPNSKYTRESENGTLPALGTSRRSRADPTCLATRLRPPARCIPRNTGCAHIRAAQLESGARTGPQERIGTRARTGRE